MIRKLVQPEVAEVHFAEGLPNRLATNDEVRQRFAEMDRALSNMERKAKALKNAADDGDDDEDENETVVPVAGHTRRKAGRVNVAPHVRRKPKSEAAGDELDQRVRQHMQATGETSYFAALSHVSKTSPALARSYAAAGSSFDGQYKRRQEGLDSSRGLPTERVPDQATAQIDRGEAGAMVHGLVMDMLRDPDLRGIDYATALATVLQLYPDLAQAYRGVVSDIDYSDTPWQGRFGRPGGSGPWSR